MRHDMVDLCACIHTCAMCCCMARVCLVSGVCGCSSLKRRGLLNRLAAPCRVSAEAWLPCVRWPDEGRERSTDERGEWNADGDDARL
eukprot:m.365105 g.365105  ORF g.365105 m.365105 type:complete len:87 (+) comp29955_c0_seq2:179-439(+)